MNDPFHIVLVYMKILISAGLGSVVYDNLAWNIFSLTPSVLHNLTILVFKEGAIELLCA